MPYPNEHASRQNSPDKYEKIRRENDKLGDGIHVIWGVDKDGNTDVQAIRFDKDKFSPSEAKKWLKDNDYKQILEEATKEKKAMDYTSSAMIALYPPPEIAQQLALSIDNAIPVNDLHLTLCYLGDVMEITGEEFSEIKYHLEKWAKSQVPLNVRVNGLARFTKETSEGLNPLVALIDSKFLDNLYYSIDSLLRWEAQIDIKNNHGFLPHITLAYIPSDDPLPIQSLPNLNFQMKKLCLKIGELKFETKLTGEMEMDTSEMVGMKMALRTQKYYKMVQNTHDFMCSLGAQCYGMDEEEEVKSKAIREIREYGAVKNSLRLIKSVEDELIVGNYLALWGDENQRDLEGILSNTKNADGSNGQWFTPETEFESDFTQIDGVLMDFEHGFKPDKIGPGDEALGKVHWKSAEFDDLGLWVTRALNRKNRYVKFLEKIGVFERGEVGTSSMARKGGVKVKSSGQIEKWALERDSLTFTPMEPRNIKGNQLQALHELAEEIPGIKKAYSACFGDDCSGGSEVSEIEQAKALAKAQSLLIELKTNIEV